MNLRCQRLVPVLDGPSDHRFFKFHSIMHHIDLMRVGDFLQLIKSVELILISNPRFIGMKMIDG